MADDNFNLQDAAEAAQQRMNGAPQAEDETLQTEGPEGDVQDEEQEEAPKRVTLRHRDRDIEVTEDELRNYAEQGLDYHLKTTKHAETLREYEAAKPLLDMIRGDQNFAAYLAAYDQIRTQQGQGAANQFAAQQGVPPEMQASINGMQQQLAQINQAAIEQSWESQLDSFREEHPEIDLPDHLVSQELEAVIGAGIKDPEQAMDLALSRLYRANAAKIKAGTIKRYTQTKQRQGPAIQGAKGGKTVTRETEPKTLKDAFESAKQRMEAAFSGGE